MICLLTKDPIGFAGGDVNSYRYVGNAPINWIDPWGIFRYAPGAGQPVDERTAEAMTCFENCIGREIIVTGARETGPPHVPGSAHETGQACDIGKISNPGLYRFDVEQCFTHCIGRYGFVWGYEGIGHFHFQTRPGKGGATDFTPGIR